MALGKKDQKEVETEAPKKAKRPHRPFYDASRGLHRLLPCIYLTAGVLLGVFFALEAAGKNALAVTWCLNVVFGLFGYAAYCIPAMLLIIGIRWRADIERRRAISRVVYYVLFMVMAEAIIWCFVADKSASYSIVAYYKSALGVFGGSLAHLLFRITSYVGVPLFTTALIGMFCYHFLEITPHKVLTFFRERREAHAATETESAEDTDDILTDDEDDEEILAARDADTDTLVAPVKEATPDMKKTTWKERRAQRRAEKQAKRVKDASEPAYEGYFPTSEGEESFGDIHRRMEREAREIERERAREEILSHHGAVSPAADVPAVVETPASADTDEGYFTPTASAPLTPTPQTTSVAQAQSADAVFGAFDPLSGDAVINTTSTILRPAGAPNDVRREAVRPVTANREEFHTVRGGVQGSGEGVGSFCIRPTPHKTPVVPPVIEPATAEPVTSTAEEPLEARPLSDFEMVTRRTDNEIQTPSPLPYVHPATQPASQPQPPSEQAIPPQGYPYGVPAAPYGQMPYPASPYPPYAPQGYPYAPAPYPTYPYPPAVSAQGMPYSPVAPAATVAPEVQETAPVTPVTPSEATPAAEIKITQHADVSDETAVEATAHVVEHHTASEPTATASARPAAAQATPPAPKRNVPNYDNYNFPPVSLLEPNINITNLNTQSEVEETSARLVGEFRKFKHNVEVKEVTVGPRVTRYCIVPPDGVRINTLTSLANDIALGLAVKSIRIEPVPNTPYLGVEIPNKTPTTVHLSSLIDTENFRSAKTVTTIPIGASVTGQPVFADIAKMPHVLIAGATGMGKSVFMNSLLLSLLYKARPDEVKLILVDPKRVELSIYNGIPHLIIPTVVEPQKAAGALIWAVGEMERRYHLMEKYGTRNIDGYNKLVRNDPSLGEHQPQIIIVIDELNDLMMQARDAVEPAIMSIAQKARAAGIYLIIGTQRPSVDVITGVIKANIPSRIAFHVSSGTDSRTILDAYGAEKLLNNGDMLASISGAEPIRMQGAFVSDDEVERVTTFLKNNAGPAVYDEIINAQIESETEKYKNSGKRQTERDSDDEDMDGSIFEDSKFMEACNIALESGKISTSLLQRRCSIGYGKAAKYIDYMESMGIVSAPDGQKPREVLMTRDQFMEMVSRESYTDD